MTDKISTLRLFSRVARLGNFTAAGKEVGLSQPSVSRIISELEANVGAALFVRNTHVVKLTEIGAEYLERIDFILSELDEAHHMVGRGEVLKGRLRVGVATSFATREIIPRLPDFLEKHPNLKLDLVLTDRRQDLIDQSIDVAIRFWALEDSTMVARKVGETKRLLVASPGYLQQAGIPKSPSELAAHKIILGPSSLGRAGWEFRKQSKKLSVRVDGQLTVTVNEAATAAAVAGIGITSTALLGCMAEIESGELVQVLPDWEIGTVEVNAVLAGGRKAKPSARVFCDFLMEAFRGYLS